MTERLPELVVLAPPTTGGEVVDLGGKAANLARATALGLPVPRWFVIPTTVFEWCSSASGMLAEIRDLLAPLVHADVSQLPATSQAIAAKVLALPLPTAITEAISTAYHQHFGESGMVAVRSSAVGEDSAAQSYAGQLDTFLFVKGEAELLSAIRRCWASAFSSRALFYRGQNGLPLCNFRVAVIVQEMVHGEVSGVLFTANPLTGNRDEALVSATFGLGEGLVSGALDADHWVVNKHTGKSQVEIATKCERIVLDTARGWGTCKVAVPELDQDKVTLTDSQLRSLLQLGERIAEQFGTPQDIEWTISAGQIYLLQTRPITVLPPMKPAGKLNLFDNSNIIESYSGVTTPLTFTFASRGYEIFYQQLGEALGFPPRLIKRCNPLLRNMIALVEGRVYYNLGNWYALLANFPAYRYLKRFFAQSIGARSTEGGPAEGPARQLGQLAYFVYRLLLNYARWDSSVEKFDRHFDAVYERVHGHDLLPLGIAELVELYLELEGELIWEWSAPIVNDFFAMLFYGLLKQLLTSWQLDESASLQNDLLCGEGGIVSTEPTRYILAMAKAVRADSSLRELFAHTDPAAIWDIINADPAHAEFLAKVKDYLQRFGYRCMGELRLEAIPLTVDPTFLFVNIANYCQIAERGGEAALDFGAIEARERAIRTQAESLLRQKLRGQPFKWLLLNRVLQDARKAVKNRENMRFARTKAFGLVREIFSEIGCKMHQHNLLDQPRDIFYLNLDEIIGWCQGRATCTNLRQLANLRKAEFDGHVTATPADRFETAGPVYLDNYFGEPDQPAVADETAQAILRGTSCCPGHVRNSVRLILPGSSDMRLSGEILVAERTDPGWIPLYPSASGLLIERGSILSHSAIVAREMGLPTIVGIKNLTKRISDGQYVEMDAQAGIVYLDRQPTNNAT
ncbi:MAG: phosphoenolpyruvate synthase [Cyanobacteria bacterium NC_groundwater_1444_Ag_S-0.65um_54_12]|nr:phosphoenolpyruvate synthase [Cyanobacteria bacterium NC_groundwater_1444_Ag_S-0.65um_54_12]